MEAPEVRRLALGAGESYEVRLAGRGARGYVWTWQVTGDADAVAVDAAPSPPVAVPPGAAVELVYTVRGTRAGGRARIRFAQIRPPYPQEAPYEELVLEVEVTPGRSAGPSGGA